MKISTLRPFKKYFIFHANGNTAAVGLLRYERLSSLYFNCDILGHQRNSCPHPIILVLVGELPYGPWIHVIPIFVKIIWSSLRDLTTEPLNVDDQTTSGNEQEQILVNAFLNQSHETPPLDTPGPGL